MTFDEGVHVVGQLILDEDKAKRKTIWRYIEIAKSLTYSQREIMAVDIHANSRD